MPTTEPTESALIIWRSAVHGARGWKLLRVSDAGAEVVADHPEDLPAMSGAWDGSRVLIAEYSGVFPGGPEEGDAVVRGYWDLLPTLAQ